MATIVQLGFKFVSLIIFVFVAHFAFSAKAQTNNVQVILSTDTNRSSAWTPVSGDFVSTNASGNILIAAGPVTASYSWSNLLGFVCHSNGTLLVQCQGTNAGIDYPQIKANSVYLGGGFPNTTLNVQLINGFQPQVGDSFVILRYGSRQGVWPRLVVPTPPTNGLWEVSYTPAGVALTVTPKQVQPVVNLTSGTSSTNLQFTVKASLGQTQILEYSTNLVDWVPAITNATYNGWLEFRKQISGESAVTYRIKQVVQ